MPQAFHLCGSTFLFRRVGLAPAEGWKVFAHCDAGCFNKFFGPIPFVLLEGRIGENSLCLILRLFPL